MSENLSPEYAQNARNAFADEAARCRRLADALTDRQTIETLNALAREYDAQAQIRSLN